jgi:hypothetical protein
MGAPAIATPHQISPTRSQSTMLRRAVHTLRRFAGAPFRPLALSRSLTALAALFMFTTYERASTKRFRSGFSLGSIDGGLPDRRRSQ